MDTQYKYILTLLKFEDDTCTHSKSWDKDPKRVHTLTVSTVDTHLGSRCYRGSTATDNTVINTVSPKYTIRTHSSYEGRLKNVHLVDLEMGTGILTDTLNYIKGTTPDPYSV